MIYDLLDKIIPMLVYLIALIIITRFTIRNEDRKKQLLEEFLENNERLFRQKLAEAHGEIFFFWKRRYTALMRILTEVLGDTTLSEETKNKILEIDERYDFRGGYEE